MTDAKLHALVQALQYHNSLFGNAHDEKAKRPAPTPDQVLATAEKFEAFLDS